MNIEELLKELKSLDPYKTQLLREQLSEYNERKTLSIVLRFFLAFFAILVYLFTR